MEMQGCMCQENGCNKELKDPSGIVKSPFAYKLTHDKSIYFVIIISLFSNLVLCSDGSDGSQPIVCGNGEFCDFDHSVFGFCQSCSNVNGTCEDQDFNNEKGETECKMVCESRSNY